MFKTSRERRVGQPNIKRIYEHWKDKLDISQDECFACGSPFRLERAHIMPLIFGGDNSVENIHILCNPCHIESEALKVYETWFEYQRKKGWKNPMVHLLTRVEKYGFPTEKLIELAPQFDNDPKQVIDHVIKTCHWRAEDFLT